MRWRTVFEKLVITYSYGKDRPHNLYLPLSDPRWPHRPYAPVRRTPQPTPLLWSDTIMTRKLAALATSRLSHQTSLAEEPLLPPTPLHRSLSFRDPSAVSPVFRLGRLDTGRRSVSLAERQRTHLKISCDERSSILHLLNERLKGKQEGSHQIG